MAMDLRKFSTPSRVRSPVLGDVTDRSTGALRVDRLDSQLMGFSFIVDPPRILILLAGTRSHDFAVLTGQSMAGPCRHLLDM